MLSLFRRWFSANPGAKETNDVANAIDVKPVLKDIAGPI
jgi:hypothetical protein